jgi:hypothetical protein
MIKKTTIVLVTAFVIGLPISSNANQQLFDCMKKTKNNFEQCTQHLPENAQPAAQKPGMTPPAAPPPMPRMTSPAAQPAPPSMPGMTPPAAPPSMPGMTPSAGSTSCYDKEAKKPKWNEYRETNEFIMALATCCLNNPKEAASCIENAKNTAETIEKGVNAAESFLEEVYEEW